MGMKFTNFATSTLAAGITNVATSLTVFTGDGGKFPTLGAGDYFYATLENLAGSREVVKVTARTGDSFGTVVRAQDGTSAVAWNAGDKVELRLVSANLNDVPKLDEVNTFSLAQTFTTAPVFTDQAGTRAAAGAAASGANSDITSLSALTSFAFSAPITASLGADVLLNNTANFFDGPSVAQGSVGKWFVSGTVTLYDPTLTNYVVKLWDGTTLIASAELTTPAGYYASASLSGFIASPAGNLRISVRDQVNTTGKIIYNISTLAKDSTITAIRIG